MVSVVSQLTDGMHFSLFGLPIDNMGLAVGTLVILFAIGYVLFCKADKLSKLQLRQ